jgi:signal transduction histidine kinase/CheY-like chemotaxis protein
MGRRYYQPWLETFMSTDLEPVSTLPPPAEASDAHRPRSSRDKALTAFAQLGCLRLNAKRSVVTLLGTTKQFILAEATQTLSLMNDSQHAGGDELWFGNSYIEREGGVSGDAMHPDAYTGRDSDGKTFTAPAAVIRDIAAHEKYKTRGYAGNGVSFYCGVPISTENGQVIGVYTVTDDKPRDGLTATELRFLVDMSTIVMQHLEVVRKDRARQRGERLIRGLGGFIEGGAMDDSPPTSPEIRPENDDQKAQDLPERPNPSTRSSSNKQPEFLGMVIQDANTHTDDSSSVSGRRPREMLRQKSSSTSQGAPAHQESKPAPSARKPPSAKEKMIKESQEVFDRAAAILRFCLGADGVAFFNASAANLSSGSRMDISGSAGRLRHAKPADRRNLTSSGQSNAQNPQGAGSGDDSPVSGDDSATTRTQSDSSSSQKRTRQKCAIMGLAVTDPDKSITLADQTLRRLVRRHPKGKCFTYDQNGHLASSDEGSEASELLSATDGSKHDSEPTPASAKVVPATKSLLKTLPGARSIVFLPLWDAVKGRWHSGLVAWSNDPGSLMNVDDNMVYLKAFSNAVMNEVHRVDLALSDTAKSTFLANISHELRSPLHGILGSIEFLHDTAMDDFQSSMVISVETCGKTLLDTVNHVLDYSKMHNLSKSHHQARGAVPDSEPMGKPETSLTQDFDMAIVVEEAVEAVYAGQVFRTANADALEGKSPIQTAASRAMQQRQERKANLGKGQAAYKSPVRLTLNIDDHISWLVRSQPGAVRRIVMNVLGNALKYTSKGSINVSLEVDYARTKSSSNLHMLLQVADTGQGMSDDFMKNHAFTAFSQENSLATGIGLGLSIVRQIVDSLGGKIDLLSEKDVGTDIRIWLSLPKSRDGAAEDYTTNNPIPEMRERTSDCEMCMLIPEAEKSVGHSAGSLVPMPTVESSMRNLVTQWFRMKVTTRKSMEGQAPDFFVFPEPPPIDYLIDFHGSSGAEKEIPVIILCTNAFEAASLRSNGIHHLTDVGRVIEIIAQPCGPQKLAKVLHRCLQRLALLGEDKDKSTSARNTPLTPQKRKLEPQQQLDDKTDQAPAQSVTNSVQDHAGSPEDGAEPQGPKEEPAPKPPSDGPVRPVLSKHAQQVSVDDTGRPRKLSDAARDGTASEEITSPGSTTNSGEDLPPTPITNDKPRVLVVDDNHINLHLLVTFVRKSGHPYQSAADGLKALHAYQKSVRDGESFRYVLMDISMPIMNGITATQEIRKFEKENGVKKPAKIIALTGMGPDDAGGEARDAGFDQFLSKPVKFKDLVKLLV